MNYDVYFITIAWRLNQVEYVTSFFDFDGALLWEKVTTVVTPYTENSLRRDYYPNLLTVTDYTRV